MEIRQLLKQAREIWGDDYKMSLAEIIIALGVVYGDLCRYERNALKDAQKHNINELRKELGNIIFSTIRWCDDLNLDPEECIKEAIKAQKKFIK
ncbi:MAG: hypothetical protein ABIG60_00700 [Patescibacteria group bacterium]